MSLGFVGYTYGSYTGTFNDVKKSFSLKHKNNPIFNRYFNGSSSSVVETDTDTLKIPYHFFVTGEEIIYSPPENDTSQAICIAPTSIPGIGLTDKLPPKVYPIKINDSTIRLSASSEDALKTVPKFLDITSVGIGSNHLFTAKNQNKKAIITIDNAIQSPITLSSVTTTLSRSIDFFDIEIYVSNTNLIYSGDLIKVDDELMLVNSVGVGSTNAISVLRSIVGTTAEIHNSSAIVTKVFGNYNIVDNVIHFVDAPYGKVLVPDFSNRPDEKDYIGITSGSSFTGRIFLKSGISDSSSEPYDRNYIFDNLSQNFNGIEKTFELKSNNSSITGISTDNIILLVNGIFQGPVYPNVSGDYEIEERSGITTITFSGNSSTNNFDVNSASIPRGGIILSVGSTQGFGYQPLVSAGGTAIVSIAGTIQSISIGNSGSGYRSGIQTVNVGVKTDGLEFSRVEYVGIATIINGNVVGVSITNPGIGYTSSNPPTVVFDAPLAYSNIPLIYSSQSASGIGTGATADIIVGQGSSIISFELKNLGYAYEDNEILTVPVGGSTGIPTYTSPGFSEFRLSVERTFEDKFSAWSIGNLLVFDSLDLLFDGERKSFPLLLNGNQTTIRSKKGSNIDVQATLLVFINDVLQVPGKGYIFNGGSIIRFPEAPKPEDKSKIIFYAGTDGIDTQLVDILETIKVGDRVTLKSDDINYEQESRSVTEIISSDVIQTNLYSGSGISLDENFLRPLTWYRQTEDLFINGQPIGKDRMIYEPYIQPGSNIIENIGSASTVIYVENIRTFFDSRKEYTEEDVTRNPQNKIIIVSQDDIVPASATATVSSAGTISGVNITNIGFGYTLPPTVSIGNPIVGFGSTSFATAVASITNGSVSSISVTNPGFGYNESRPPQVLISSPNINYETISKISYKGDFGYVVGFGCTNVSNINKHIFDLYIPQNSYLRDPDIVGTAITLSEIEVNDFFVIKNTNIGFADTEFYTCRVSGSIIGLSTSYVDGIYQVSSKEIVSKNIVGIGITNVVRIAANVELIGYNYEDGGTISTSNYFGDFSWGKIIADKRIDPKNFNSYGFSGISSSPYIIRYNRLAYNNYNN